MVVAGRVSTSQEKKGKREREVTARVVVKMKLVVVFTSSRLWRVIGEALSRMTLVVELPDDDDDDDDDDVDFEIPDQQYKEKEVPTMQHLCHDDDCDHTFIDNDSSLLRHCRLM